jgi:antitoxin component YwqK of YwqJK toxin-antitoxin module
MLRRLSSFVRSDLNRSKDIFDFGNNISLHESYHANGMLAKQEFFINNKQIGPSIKFDRNGNVYNINIFNKNGNFHGTQSINVNAPNAEAEIVIQEKYHNGRFNDRRESFNICW